MPYYSELGLYSGPSTSSYVPLYLPGPYSNHSSIVSNNFSRPSPTYIKSSRGYRNYKPHLTTISERRTDSPLRRINSPKVTYTPVIIPRPIKINTADIDVSINKYKKYERPRSKPDGVSEIRHESKSPSPSKLTESPRSSTELKEATPSANIKRERATVRLRTIHKDKIINPVSYRKWRDNFKPDELYPDESDSMKIMKKTPGELMKEKFLIPSEHSEESSEMPEKKIERRKSVKSKQGVVKSPSFHDICTAITSEPIDQELNPGQPENVQRKQSRQFSTEEILQEIRRTSVELSDSDKNVIDAILTKVEAAKSNDNCEKEYNSRGSVKKRKKYNKSHSSRLSIDSTDDDQEKQTTLQRRPTLKRISRTKSPNLNLDQVQEAIQSMETNLSTKESELECPSNKKEILLNKKQVITATVHVEEKPVLKAIIDDIEIEESSPPKQKKEGRFKLSFTVEEIQQSNSEKEKSTPEVESTCNTDTKKEIEPKALSNKKPDIEPHKSETVKVEVPVNKKSIISNIIKKKHTARMGLILEELNESCKERNSSKENKINRDISTNKPLKSVKSEEKNNVQRKEVMKNNSSVNQAMNNNVNILNKNLTSTKNIFGPKVKRNSSEIKKTSTQPKIREINNNTITKSESSEDFWKAIGPRESTKLPIIKKLIVNEELKISPASCEVKKQTEAEIRQIEENCAIKNNVQEKEEIVNMNNKEQITEESVGGITETEMKRMISKRSLIQKAKQDDPDLVVFEPPPEPQVIEEENKEESKKDVFVPLQSNRLSQWMHPFKKPEQFEECPVEIYARPKSIRKRHLPRGRFGQWERCNKSDSSSEEGTDDSSESDDDSSSEEECTTGRVGANYGASTSSNDSGFDSGAAKNKEKGSTGDARDSPSSNPATNPAFAIDPNEEECCKSNTYQGFQRSGRITPPATTIPRFRKYCVEDFNFLKVLGKGSFGKVLLAELKDTEYYYAIKCLKKDVVLEDDDVECTLIERKVLALGTKHPYLCHLLCTFQTESHLFFVMEYLNGGDLMFHIQQTGRFPEERARFYAAEIVSGLKFLHNKGIVYRDLKLDNILLDFDGHVRIADFGMCKLQVFLDRMADTFCGTPDYMAPEIIRGQHYNQSVDWWSFGVLLYEMLLAQSPFSGCDEDELFWSICNEKPVLPRFLSPESSRILSMLLDKDANKRLGTRFSPCGDIKDQPFFRSIDWDKLESRMLEPPFKPNLSHPLDTKYFDKHFTTEQAKLTPIEHHILQSMDQTQFQGFSYTNPNATDK